MNATKATATNMVLFNRLPVEVQQALGGPKNIHLLTGDVLVREKIRDFFQGCYALEASLNAWRKRHGYCQGLPSCDRRVEKGEHHCATCNAAYARYKKNAGTPGPITRAGRRSNARKPRRKRALRPWPCPRRHDVDPISCGPSSDDHRLRLHPDMPGELQPR